VGPGDGGSRRVTDRSSFDDLKPEQLIEVDQHLDHLLVAALVELADDVGAYVRGDEETGAPAIRACMLEGSGEAEWSREESGSAPSPPGSSGDARSLLRGPTKRAMNHSCVLG
jgi:hypothetical protein